MKPPKRILVAVLDWGLGHATRCIPLINELQKRHCEIFIASSGRAYQLLKKEFLITPHIFEIASYEPEYPHGNNMVLKMGLQLGKFFKTIQKEQQQIEKIVEHNHIDFVISDNRYGAYSTNVPSVFITHQLQIQLPFLFKWMQKTVNKKNHEYINRFTECWVPAPKKSFISTLIQNTSDLKVRHIGYLSRFEKINTEKKFDVCVVCSGPEPQRTYFDDMLYNALKKSSLQSIIVRGKPESKSKYSKKNQQLTIANYLTGKELNEIIEQSEIIIARSGYSTVMDLTKLDKKAIFIPTPGQTEQSYIAAELMKTGIAFSMPQNKFNLETALKESKNYSGFKSSYYDNSLLQNALDLLLNEKII